MWNNANILVVFKIWKHCTDNVQVRIKTIASTKDDFNKLKLASEIKMTIEYYAFL
jgi:hypothetical protein